jgi:hypothetical protein
MWISDFDNFMPNGNPFLIPNKVVWNESNS